MTQRERSIKRLMKYMDGVDKRRAKRLANKNHFMEYGRDNQGAANKAGKCKRFRNVPPQYRHIAEQEFIRLWMRAKRQGKPITQQKIGSMLGNAACIAIHYRASNNAFRWRKKFFQSRMWLQKLLSEGEPVRLPKGASRTKVYLNGI